jgi:hypothetical protein
MVLLKQNIRTDEFDVYVSALECESNRLAKSAGDGPQAREITGRLAARGKAGY